MGERKYIPAKVQTNVQTNSAGRCVICYGTGKCTDPMYPNVQIAHIDKDNENNQEDNLALLCIHCHNLYDSTLRQGKNYTAGAIKTWRKKLYDDVQNGRLPLAIGINTYHENINIVSSSGYSEETIFRLRNFLEVAGKIVDRLCNDGTYLAIRIEYVELDFISDNFSSWMISDLRCRNRKLAGLQDELIEILWELYNSYHFMGTLDEAPNHIIPMGYYNDIGQRVIKVSDNNCCRDLYNIIPIREEWIRTKLRRLNELYCELDSLSMD